MIGAGTEEALLVPCGVFSPPALIASKAGVGRASPWMLLVCPLDTGGASWGSDGISGSSVNGWIDAVAKDISSAGCSE